MSAVHRSAAMTSDRTTARRGLLIFLPLVAVLDVLFVAVIVTTGNPLWIYALMWSVAATSVLCRVVLRDGFGDVSFRFGGRRSLAFVVAGAAFPVIVGFVAFGTGWATGLATFTAPPGGFLAGLLLAATVGTALGALSAAGEEIGWRGYMLTRLIDAGVPRPVLVSGLIWGLWHLPLIVTGVIYGDNPRLLAVVVFMVSATAMGFVIARFRLETGSIWPPIALHAAYNSVIQSAFAPATTGPGEAVWVGEEAGILVALTLVLAAVLVSLGTWRMFRSPGRPMAAPSSA
jgi:membrane protease YdiL (CAAX protease family)